MMKLVLLTIISIFVIILYGQTQCDCELGVYLKDVGGECKIELKKFETPEIMLGCDEIFDDWYDSIRINECQTNGINFTVFTDKACKNELFTEFLPAGECKFVDIDNHSVALGTSCGESY